MALLAGKTVLITGASRGIGLAMAERFAAEGANLVLVASRLGAHGSLPGSLQEAVAKVAERGVRAVALVANLADPNARQSVISEAEALLGPIDILVNNAAVALARLPSQCTLKERQLMFELNVNAPIDLCQQVLPSMRERGQGWILNISSSAVSQPTVPYRDSREAAWSIGTYGASKLALNRFSEALAHEEADDGVFVNSLAPESIAMTPGAAHVAEMAHKNPDMVEPVEVMAEAALALCSSHQLGRVCYSRSLLHSLGRPVRSLDGQQILGDAFISAFDR